MEEAVQTFTRIKPQALKLIKFDNIGLKRSLSESNNINRNRFLLEKKSTYKYGCVMLELNFPDIKQIHSKIKKEDLYKEPDNDKFGLEKETHITLLYGLHDEVSLKDISGVLDSFEFPEEIKIHNVSLFENEKYDVLKFDVDCKLLHSVNKKLCKFPYTNEYPDYQPHLTIAYLKSGKGKDYVKLFKNKKFYLTPKKCTYSQPDGTKSKIDIEIE